MRRWHWWNSLSESQQTYLRAKWHFKPPTSPPVLPPCPSDSERLANHKRNIQDARKKKRDGTYIDLRGSANARRKGVPKRQRIVDDPVPANSSSPYRACSGSVPSSSRTLRPSVPVANPSDPSPQGSQPSVLTPIPSLRGGKLRIGTLNVTTLTGRLVHVLEIMDVHSLDVLALQECRVTPMNRLALQAALKRRGLFFHIGPASPTMSRHGVPCVFVRGCAVISRVPIYPVSLPLHLPRDRVVAVKILLGEPLTLWNIHAPTEYNARTHFLRDLLVELTCEHGAAAVIGDFNAEWHRTPFADSIRAGRVRQADLETSAPDLLTGTRPSQPTPRIIDYMIVRHSVPLARWACTVPWTDHDLVAYDLQMAMPPPSLILRRPPPLLPTSSQIHGPCLPPLVSNDVELLSVTDAALVWQQQVQRAEHMLAVAEPCNQQAHRGRFRTQVAGKPASIRHCGSVRTRRLHHAVNRQRLLIKLAVSHPTGHPQLESLQRKQELTWTWLQEVQPFDLHTGLQRLLSLHQETENADKSRRLARWEEATKHSSKAIPMASKRLKIALAAEQPHTCAAAVEDTLQEQEHAWMQLWYRPGAAQPIIPLPTELPIVHPDLFKRVLSGMRGKAPGMDNITSSVILSLPDDWICQTLDLLLRFARQGVWPPQLAEVLIALLPKKTTQWRPISLESVFTRALFRCFAIMTRQVMPQVCHDIVHGGIPGRGTSTVLVDAWEHIKNRRGQPTFALTQDLAKAFDNVDRMLLLQAIDTYLAGPLRDAALVVLQWILQHSKVFVLQGVTLGRRLDTNWGIPQGNSFSMWYLAILTTEWAKQMYASPLIVHHPVSICTYVDDRVVIGALGMLAQTRELMQQIDQAMHWSTDTSKDHLATTTIKGDPIPNRHAMVLKIALPLCGSALSLPETIIAQGTKSAQLLGLLGLTPRIYVAVFASIVGSKIAYYAPWTHDPYQCTQSLVNLVDRIACNARYYGRNAAGSALFVWGSAHLHLRILRGVMRSAARILSQHRDPMTLIPALPASLERFNLTIERGRLHHPRYGHQALDLSRTCQHFISLVWRAWIINKASPPPSLDAKNLVVSHVFAMSSHALFLPLVLNQLTIPSRHAYHRHHTPIPESCPCCGCAPLHANTLAFYSQCEAETARAWRAARLHPNLPPMNDTYINDILLVHHNRLEAHRVAPIAMRCLSIILEGVPSVRPSFRRDVDVQRQ